MSLDPQQQAAVDAREPLIACVAGAGSGKTRALTARIAGLLYDGVHPTEILALTFTRKAAGEMRERLEALGIPPRTSRRLTVTTFHAWCAARLREFAEDLGLDRRFTIRDEADREDLVKFVGAELGLKFKSAERLWQEPRVRARYYELLREAHAVDFDMLETEMLRLLANIEARAVLQARYQHVLVDEYQDTSELQQRILDQLGPRNTFVVGDGSQSIYGFRGANVDGFVAYTRRAGVRVQELASNYRSHPLIVRAASRVAQAMAVPGLNQFTTLDWNLDYDAIGVNDSEDVAEEIAIESALRGGPGGMAVLAPTWRHLEQLAEVLAARAIPHRVARKALDLWATDEARWLIACLRVVHNQHDHIALWAALNAFAPRVTRREWAAARAAAASDGSPVSRHIHDGHSAPLLLAIGTARLGAQEGLLAFTEVIQRIATEIDHELRELHLDHRLEAVTALEDAIGDWYRSEPRPEDWPPLDAAGAFLDWYSTRQLGDVDEPDAVPAVTLTTIHGAKGLEWPCVWVLGCDEGTLPRQGDAASIEEQRRLFYVATTRARDRLRWCASGTPSRFIAEALGQVVPA